MGQPDCSRWHVAAGLSGIDTLDRRDERRDDRDRNGNREDRQGHMNGSSAAPVEIVVHGQHLPLVVLAKAAVALKLRYRPPGTHG